MSHEQLTASLYERYSIECEIGRGGMATVYAARDLKHERRVAIKVLDAGVAPPDGAERFIREIRTSAQLTHPHLLPLHDSGEAGGCLYYVMPYVEGGTLRNLLDREGRLALSQACLIASQVADALDHAHRHGIIHRDIKPENILLPTADHAVVADFGLARALSAVSSARLTSTGVAIGSPHYMSPEQIAGEVDLDARTDVYALACVTYEMLAGEPPFTGTSLQAVIAAHLTQQPRPIRAIRPDVPPSVSTAVQRALVKGKAERTPGAADFRRDLAGARERQLWFAGGDFGWRSAVALLVLALVVVALWTTPPLGGSFFTPRAPLDSTRFVVLPFLRSSGSAPDIRVDWLLHDALARWQGIVVVPPLQVGDEIARSGAPSTLADASDLARRLGAGRFVSGEVRQSGNAVRLAAGVYDTNGARYPLHQANAVLPLSQRLAWDSLANELADRLLFAEPLEGSPAAHAIGTTSRAARIAYERGRSDLIEWRLAAAESAFVRAITHDPGYAQAHLWIAQVRAWRGEPARQWEVHAQRAQGNRSRLLEPERLLASALVHLASGENARACAEYGTLIARDSLSFAPWFGRGECLRLDDRVVPDRLHAGRWSFVSSAERAVRAYRRAFELFPAVHRLLRERGFAHVRTALYTSSFVARNGFDENGNSFLALPALEADTLAFWAYPEQQFRQGAAQISSATRRRAVVRQAEIFRDIAAGWVAAYPESASALFALAVAEELAGEPAALQTIRRARELEPERNAVDLAAAEVWLLVKFGYPGDEDRLRDAAQLADSVLLWPGPHAAADLRRLAGLAALRGRPATAARFAAEAVTASSYDGLPVEIQRDAQRLTVFAALGGPPDSLAALERRIEAAIATFLPRPDRAAARYQLLGRPASLAFDRYRFGLVTDGDLRSDYLLEAVRTFGGVDTAGVGAEIDRWKVRNAAVEPSIDGALSEALLLVRVGRGDLVRSWLEPSLEALVWSPPLLIDDATAVAAIVRGSIELARAHAHAGDTAAAEVWARPVTILWNDAEPPLREGVRDMRSLMAREH